MVRRKNPPNLTNKNKRKINDADNKKNQNDSQIKKRKQTSIKVLVQHHPRTQSFPRKVFKEIRNLQMTTQPLIPLLSFQRLVREIIQGFTTIEGLRIQTEALRALQEATEMYMTQYLEDAYFCSLHAKRKTLFVSDMQCVRRLRGRNDIINH